MQRKIYDEERIDELLAGLKEKLIQATLKHGPMNSPHEGYAVILEETDELWEHVKADTARTPKAMVEAFHIAAMGLRFILDMEEKPVLFSQKNVDGELPV